MPTVPIPSSQKAPLRAAIWFAPLFVAEVFIRGISSRGLLRQRFIAVSTLKLRPGKIFIDYLRNSRGEAVASYSLRAREGAPVALPLAWSQLTRLSAGNEFDLRTVPKRLRRRRKDPWEGINTIKHDLSRCSAG